MKENVHILRKLKKNQSSYPMSKHNNQNASFILESVKHGPQMYTWDHFG
jgi:hypothetical protein